jgi:hypothetical protein
VTGVRERRPLPTETTGVPARPRRRAASASARAEPASGGRGRGDGERPPVVSGPKLNAEAEPEFDKHPDCLGSFAAYKSTPVFKRLDATYCGFEAPFTVFAEFKPPCRCSQLEYRQFIRGHITRDPDGDAEDRGDLLSKLPLGRLWESYQEDGDTSDTPSKYGYRGNPAVERDTLVDHYLNAKGDADQANGCKYEGVDTPWAQFASKPGEVWDITLEFHGDILRDGRALARRFWTPIQGRFSAP